MAKKIVTILGRKFEFIGPEGGLDEAVQRKRRQLAEAYPTTTRDMFSSTSTKNQTKVILYGAKQSPYRVVWTKSAEFRPLDDDKVIKWVEDIVNDQEDVGTITLSIKDHQLRAAVEKILDSSMHRLGKHHPSDIVVV